MDFNALFEMIENFGFPVVMAIILAIILYNSVKNNNNKKLNILLDYITEKNESELKKGINISENLYDDGKNMNKVQEIIYQLLKEVDGDRLSIFEYHNGGKTLNGIDFKKCTNTYESVDLNIERKFKDYQNLPISTNILWTQLLYNRKMINISDINTLKSTDKTLYANLISQDIKSYYSMLLFDYDSRPIGFLELTYYNKEYKLTTDELQLFNNTAISIAGLLSKK